MVSETPQLASIVREGVVFIREEVADSEANIYAMCIGAIMLIVGIVIGIFAGKTQAQLEFVENVGEYVTCVNCNSAYDPSRGKVTMFCNEGNGK